MIQMGEEIDRRDPWSVAAFQPPTSWPPPPTRRGENCNWWCCPSRKSRASRRTISSTYVNYYVCNGAVIAAEFDDEDADEEAEEILHTLYPGREVVMLKFDPVGEVGGGIHCATHEQPKV